MKSSVCILQVGKKTNQTKFEVRGSKQTAYAHNLDMLHVKHIHGPGLWEGISPLKVLANTLRYDKAVQEFSLSEMEKKESFILKYAANLDKEKRQAVVDDFKRFYAENGGILLARCRNH